ncbi:coiled-coil domain-containing protein 153 isoform X2 [Coturnix japonica]|uniref:coiled-coil domain-containing protein 153 isoform X2 n=1 Tax=Coturnix japonica TaxID=93934 RepID=UPI000776FF7C|nr:coiled-coil domain-containing protein 153 isoform X2 [Coturnix japonica]
MPWAASRYHKLSCCKATCPHCTHSCYNNSLAWRQLLCAELCAPSFASRMPPKGKGKRKNGVKQHKKGKAAESQAAATSRRAALEADRLQEHPVHWRDMVWKVRADSDGLRRRLWELEQALEQAQEDKRDMHAEMTRQYQELQKQTASYSQRLEAKVKSLQEQLATMLQESQHIQQAATKALAERDRTITQLQGRIDIMQREYKKIFHDSLDLVLDKMAEARQHWKEEGTTICLEYKQHLQEFGLNPLEI